MTDAPAHREGDEHPLGRPRDDIEQGLPRFLRGRDVEKAYLVRPHRVVGRGALDRVARVAEALEINPLDDAALLHVEAGDDPLRQH